MQDLLDKFSLDHNKKIFLIFDVDGTLRADTVDCLDHRYPKIDPEAAIQLMELNTLDNVRVAILTARSYVDIFRSNLPKNLIKYCGFGKQIVKNDVLRYAREDFHRAHDETTMFIDIIKDIIGPKLTANLDFLITPGDFAIYFELQDYEEHKQKIMEIVELILFNSKRWQIKDYGKEVIFKDLKYSYNKGDAIRDILDGTDLNDLTQVFFFGDSRDDYPAMIALRDYQKQYPGKRIKVNSISVGPTLLDEPNVDYNFESHDETIAFVKQLHAKLNMK